MKVRTAIIILMTSGVVTWSCNSGQTNETPGGFKYSVIVKGDGKVVKPGQVLVMNMMIVDENDSVWHDSRQNQYPELVKIQGESVKSTEHGLNEAYRTLSKGDSITFKMRAKDFFPLVWKTSPPSYMDPETSFTAQIKCREVLDEGDYKRFITKLDSINYVNGASRYDDLEKMMTSEEGDQHKTDITIIDAYLRSKNMNAQPLRSGLRYILKSEGRGNAAVAGDFVNMKYVGQTLDGREFDSGEYGFTVGAADVIEGWDEIATIMKEGTALTVFIPSTMAYKHGGRPPVIMPDAILIFDMELLTLKKR